MKTIFRLLLIGALMAAPVAPFSTAEAQAPRRTVTVLYYTGTPSTATATTASGVALAANPQRRYCIIYNLGTVNVFLGVNAPAVSGSGILIQPNGGWYEMTDGILSQSVINCISASGTAALSILEGT